MKKQTSLPGLAEHDLESQALSLVNSKKYKEAIKLFKKILQTNNNDEWRQKIAYCYIQRAIEFANKGMYKEALVLWENHVEYTQPPYQVYDQYIIWLIQINNPEKTQAALTQLSARQLDKDLPDLASILGFMMLSQHPEFQQYLPQDCALIADFNKVQMALQAYQDNDFDKLNEIIKQLPYRSAYRDFRTLLNAVVLLPQSADQAKTLLNKITIQSTYAPTANILLNVSKEGADLAEGLSHLTHQQRKIIYQIKGFNKKQCEFTDSLCKSPTSTSKQQFKLAIQFKSFLGNDVTQQFCQKLLASYPAGKGEFTKHFKIKNHFEKNRAIALQLEKNNEHYDADYYWRKCIKLLISEKNESNDLKVALILRHMARSEEDGSERVELLIKSLEHDPSDRTCYDQILHYFGQQTEFANEYKYWLTKTIEQFPKDVEALTLIVKAATNNKTYKKACQFATKILKIDPLNTFAKQTLFSSYLAHARRLMREKNYRLVEKEIIQLEKLNISKAHVKQTQLMHALLIFANEDKKQGLSAITDAISTLHTDPVNMHFQASMEAMLNGLPLATILRELSPPKKHCLSVTELTALIQQIEYYADSNDDNKLIHKALDKIKAALKISLLEQDYSEEVFLNLYKILDKVDHYELLRHCVKSIPFKWKGLIWKFYRIYANTNGIAEDCSFMEVQRLLTINDQAREINDQVTGLLIEKYLNDYYAAHPQRGFGFLDSLFNGHEEDNDEFEEFEDPLEEIFGHLPERIMNDLTNKAESIMKKTTPDKLIEGLIFSLANPEAVLMQIMKNPDMLFSLVLVKAADALNLDIDVDVNDIIEAFKNSRNDNSFPFPF